MTESDTVIELDGRAVRLTNLDKVLWPQVGLNKAWLINYYRAVAHAIVPHLHGRPSTLHRFPDGVEGNHWFQTRAPAHPPWLRTIEMRPPTGKVFDVIAVDDSASLIWAANAAAIELHPYLGVARALDEPLVAGFVLDPGDPADIVDCCDVALMLRELLVQLDLRASAKTSGGKGLHVYVPLNTPHSYNATKGFARATAELLRQRMPDRVVTTMARAQRRGKVFVDWSQNDYGKSTIAPYSLRGFEIPTVSLPLDWTEVEGVARSRS